MMRKITLLFLFTIGMRGAFAQSPNAAKQSAINDIAASLQANPNNPLNINKDILVTVGNALPEGSLKSTILSYGANFGIDQNLSMRQIYYDLNTALAKNPQIPALGQFNQTSRGLDILMNHSEDLISAFKNGAANYKPGMFMNDPNLMTGLKQMTGNADAAQGLGIAAELAAGIIADAQRRKAFRAEYKSYADISSQMLYLETDNNLRKALIDANLGHIRNNDITPIFKYDFDNGSSIRVENGILKYVNEQKKIIKNLFAAEDRNDGKTKAGTEIQEQYTGKIVNPVFAIYPDRKSVMIYTGKIKSDKKCDQCLTSDQFYRININDGEVTKFKNIYQSLDAGPPRFKGTYRYQEPLIYKDSVLYMGSSTLRFIDPITTKFREVEYMDNGLPSEKFIFPYPQQELHFVEHYYTQPARPIYDNENLIYIHWWTMGKGTDMMNTSLLAIYEPQKNQHINEYLANTLTGLTVSEKGIMYFVTPTGGIGKIDINQTKMNSPEFVPMLKKSEVKPGLPSYDFRGRQPYLYDGDDGLKLYNVPSLWLTPNEKYLVYVIKSQLYVIDANNFSNYKSFDMTIQPYSVFFGKENDETTLYLRAYNDFNIPVTKKYALSKLINAQMDPKKPIVKKTEAKVESAKKEKSSVVDEIKKLKALLDDGTITKAEFDTAKKKLLDGN